MQPKNLLQSPKEPGYFVIGKPASVRILHERGTYTWSLRTISLEWLQLEDVQLRKVLTHDIVRHSVQKSIEHPRIFLIIFHCFTFPFCKSGVPIRKIIRHTVDDIDIYLSGM